MAGPVMVPGNYNAWRSSTITWSFALYNYPQDSGYGSFSNAILDPAWQAVVEHAIQTWEAVADIQFVEVPDSADPSQSTNIRIGFSQLATPTTHTIGETIRSLYSSGPTFASDVRVELEDPAQDPLIAEYGGFTWQGSESSLYQVALHEIGHALGLVHSGDPSAVMYPSAGTGNRGLDASDIAQIRALYGAPQGTNFGNSAVQSALSALTPSSGKTNLAPPSNGINVPPAIPGELNVLDVYSPAPGGTLMMPRGYQAEALMGSTTATLIDSQNGHVLMTAFDGSNVLWDQVGGDTLVGGAGGSRNWLGGSANGSMLVGTAGNDTIMAAGGNSTVIGGILTSLVGLSGNSSFLSQGKDTVIAGTGSETIAVVADGSDAVFGGQAAISFIGGANPSTVLGGLGSDTDFGGIGGGVFQGGQAGHNALVGQEGAATLYGGGEGDTLYAGGYASDLLVAGTGNETLNGLGSAANDTFYGGSGNTLIGLGGGRDMFVAGRGDATVFGGAYGDSYAVVNGQAGGSVQIWNFDPTDRLNLFGYGANAIAWSPGAGGVMATLPDHTTITFVGLPSVNPGQVVG